MLIHPIWGQLISLTSQFLRFVSDYFVLSFEQAVGGKFNHFCFKTTWEFCRVSKQSAVGSTEFLRRNRASSAGFTPRIRIHGVFERFLCVWAGSCMYGVMCLKPYNAESQGHLKRVQNIILQLEIPGNKIVLTDENTGLVGLQFGDSEYISRWTCKYWRLWLQFKLEIVPAIQAGIDYNSRYYMYNSSWRLCLKARDCVYSLWF